jgi:hypothetical protein
VNGGAEALAGIDWTRSDVDTERMGRHAREAVRCEIALGAQAAGIRLGIECFEVGSLWLETPFSAPELSLSRRERAKKQAAGRSI